MKRAPALHPDQFKVNEAWIAFQLNDEPIHTEQDGSFDVVCLMDAASCYIFGNAFVPLGQVEPTEFDAHRLLKSGWCIKSNSQRSSSCRKASSRRHSLPRRNGRTFRSSLSPKGSFWSLLAKRGKDSKSMFSGKPSEA